MLIEAIKSRNLAFGLLFGAGIVLIGLFLQLTVGAIEWTSITYPINICLVSLFLILLVTGYIFRARIRFVRWMGRYPAAISALAWVIFLTLILGFTKQIPDDQSEKGIWGISHMLSFWPFLLVYCWLASILGLVVLSHLFPFRWRHLPFICNHLGLFIAMVSAALGNADVKQLTMNVHVGQSEWRGLDKDGIVHDLPLKICLKKFSIDEYPPKLTIVSNKTGEILLGEKTQSLSLGKSITQGTLFQWKIQVNNVIQTAAPVQLADSINYIKWSFSGATDAAYVKATNSVTKVHREGWVSCGSFLFPYQILLLDSISSIVMPGREPKRYSSEVEIFTQSGKKVNAEIEVNKPFKIDGWKIYQYGYDEEKGRWSDSSIFQFVYDPWLPFVYAGIYLMMAGAVCMFVIPEKRKEERI